jgi:hypothetical protein
MLVQRRTYSEEREGLITIFLVKNNKMKLCYQNVTVDFTLKLHKSP